MNDERLTTNGIRTQSHKASRLQRPTERIGRLWGGGRVGAINIKDKSVGGEATRSQGQNVAKSPTQVLSELREPNT
jgi:hypothetical protein